MLSLLLGLKFAYSGYFIGNSHQINYILPIYLLFSQRIWKPSNLKGTYIYIHKVATAAIATHRYLEKKHKSCYRTQEI